MLLFSLKINCYISTLFFSEEPIHPIIWGVWRCNEDLSAFTAFAQSGETFSHADRSEFDRDEIIRLTNSYWLAMTKGMFDMLSIFLEKR